MASQFQRHPVETHEEFVVRAARVFPVRVSASWTRLERAVFNYLMARLIFRHDYAEISESMLEAASDEMHEIVRGCTAAAQPCESGHASTRLSRLSS